MSKLPKVLIVGAGPAGLFCAFQLLKKGHSVELYDHSSGVGKKFLIAGNGGLNLTHSEKLEVFKTRYAKNEELFRELLRDFSPNDLRDFCQELGVETFVGSSGRVFPVKLKAAEILINWVHKLKSFDKFKLFLNHDLVQLDSDKYLTFKNENNEVRVKGDFIVLALGGASWKKTGSDGVWSKLLCAQNIELADFLPMNCAFKVKWSDFFIENVNRHPLKNISVSFKEHHCREEVMLTPFGIEGGGIYQISNYIRDEIKAQARAVISIDLCPDLNLEELEHKVSEKKEKTSLSNHLRKKLGLNKKTFIFLKEVCPKLGHKELAKELKNLKLELTEAAPIDEAISTSGGVMFKELTDSFELKKLPGFYVCGEMLDFEAPTGGYLLQGCFSSAFRVSKGIFSK